MPCCGLMVPLTAATAHSLWQDVLPSPMSSWRDAVQERDGGITLLLEASPGAGHTRFPDGYNPWRGRLGIRVREPARDGRANQAVLEAIAQFFGVPAARVHLEGGASDSRKLVWVQDVALADARRLLAGALEA